MNQELDKGWFPRLKAIEFLGVTPSKFNHQILPELPRGAVHRDDHRRTFINGPMLVKHMMQQAVQGESDQEDLFTGSGSPELIRARIDLLREQTKLRRMEVQTKQESVVDRDQVHEVFAIIGGFIRDGVDKLQRVYGRDAYDLIMEKLEDAERTIRQRFGDAAKHNPERESSSDTDDETAED